MSATVNRYPRYCWVVLGLAWLVMVVTTWGWNLIPSLAYQLFPDLGLTQFKYTLIFTAPVLMTMFVALPGGALADRYGIRIVVGISAFVAAITGFLRAYTPTFGGMFFLMCLRGIAWGMTIPNLPKLVGIWFPPKRTGLASGIYLTGMGMGSALGLFTGPLFPDWRAAFIITGIINLIVAVLWAVFARSCPEEVSIDRPSIISGLKAGIKSKNIWLVGVAQFLFMGALMSFQGNLVKAYIGVHQMSPQTAATLASFLTLGLATGNLTLPALSDRVGLRRPFIFIGATAGAILLFLSWKLAPSPVIWATAFIGGVITGGAPPVMFAVPAELPEIGEGYIGGASGLAVALMNAGGFLLTLLITSPVMAPGTASAYNSGFLISVLLLAAIVLPAFFLLETGRRSLRGSPPFLATGGDSVEPRSKLVFPKT